MKPHKPYRFDWKSRSLAAPALATLAGVSLAASTAGAQDDWTKRFRIGASAGFTYSYRLQTQPVKQNLSQLFG